MLQQQQLELKTFVSSTEACPMRHAPSKAEATRSLSEKDISWTREERLYFSRNLNLCLLKWNLAGRMWTGAAVGSSHRFDGPRAVCSERRCTHPSPDLLAKLSEADRWAFIWRQVTTQSCDNVPALTWKQSYHVFAHDVQEAQDGQSFCLGCNLCCGEPRKQMRGIVWCYQLLSWFPAVDLLTKRESS